eukprot:3807802-Karenia_brevis.AAC.1
MDQRWSEATMAYHQLQEQLKNSQILASQANDNYATIMAMEQSKWQQQSDALTHELQLMQAEAENYRLDK